MLPLASIRPSPENDRIYKPVDPHELSIRALSDDMRVRGVIEPLHVTRDGYIISGHRRWCAANLAGLIEVRCIIHHDVIRETDPDGFVKLLVAFNQQRVKSTDEQLHEVVIQTSEAEAYAHLKKHRRLKSDHDQILAEHTAVAPGEKCGRAAISQAKSELVTAIENVLDNVKEFWPVSDRQIHYRLLSNPPLIHASKPASRYGNNIASYRALTDILTRMRLAGLIPWRAISDETRTITTWRTWQHAGAFMAGEIESVFTGYWRDLLQSQPSHVEIVAEKLTVKGIVQRVAQDYTIPVTIGRGYCSIQPRHELAQRFKRSGREKLLLLILSDFEPDGEGIASSFVRSLRDDFNVNESRVTAIKVGLTAEQVRRFELPPILSAKESSSRFKAFEERYGRDAWELEALPSETLADELRRTIESVLDMEVLEAERKREAEDAQQLEAYRARVRDALGGLL